MWIETFCEMVRVDSESGDEARFIEHLQTILERELDKQPLLLEPARPAGAFLRGPDELFARFKS